MIAWLVQRFRSLTKNYKIFCFKARLTKAWLFLSVSLKYFYIIKYKSILARNLICYLLLIVLSVCGSCKKDPLDSVFDYRTLGSSANDLLSSSRYPKLQIEIQYMPGYAPDASSVNNLVAFLKTRINKPGDITIIQEEIGASVLPVSSLNNIVSIERTYRKHFTGNGVISVYVLITNGYYSNSNIFATSYWNTSVCLFGNSINDNSGHFGQVSRSILMTTLLEHEFGHLMGLVDQGSPMLTNHKDSSNGAHCDNPDCLMYYDVEAGFAATLNAVPSLDANCLADLKANGGK